MPPCQSMDKADGSNGFHVETSAEFNGDLKPTFENGEQMNGNKDKKGKMSPDEYLDELKAASPLTSTFHWEMLIFCVSVLGSLYYLLPSGSAYRTGMHVLFGLLALDATRYYVTKGGLSGVPYTPPLVSLLAMLVYPVRFWEECGRIAMKSKDGMCSNLLAGNFMVFITNPKLCREIFTSVETFQIFAHPNARWLFGEKNLIYIEKQRHKRFRALMTPALFSAEALSGYYLSHLRVLHQFLNKYAAECAETGKPIDTRIAFRTMAAAASQESFLGPYLNDELRKEFEKDIVIFTLGFLCFPCPYVGGLRKAILAKQRIEKRIIDMIPKSKKYIVEENGKPRCLLDYWIQSMKNHANETGINYDQVDGSNVEDMARSVLDSLFAAQDATNSALVYCTDVLDVRPDVCQKVREEVQGVFGGKNISETDDATFSKVLSHNTELPYTDRVGNQLLHHKPPVPMVPHLVLKTTNLAGHHIPKGAVVIPSITYSSRINGGALDFEPDRDDQDNLFVKTMTFGAGQHKCPGRMYAQTLAKAFVAILCNKFEFSRVGERPNMDEFIFFPTLFPKENMFMISKMK